MMVYTVAQDNSCSHVLNALEFADIDAGDRKEVTCVELDVKPRPTIPYYTTGVDEVVTVLLLFVVNFDPLFDPDSWTARWFKLRN